MNPDRTAELALRAAGDKGAGVFTGRTYGRGERILRFRGRRMPLERVRDFTHVIQVGPTVFLGPSGGIDDFVNHSCDPNAALRATGGRLELFALRRLLPGQEITFDYSTCIVDEPALDGCLCGSPRCRGRVVAYRDLPPRVRARYARLGAVPSFVLESVLAPSVVTVQSP